MDNWTFVEIFIWCCLPNNAHSIQEDGQLADFQIFLQEIEEVLQKLYRNFMFIRSFGFALVGCH